jgi:NhaC family Na+:H+ antiporter
VFVSSTLGVPTILYLPFAIANWCAPIIDLFWGFTGWFTPQATEQEQQYWEKEQLPIMR